MMQQTIRIEREWAMPNHKTFEIKPIKKLIQEELGNEFLDLFPYPYTKDALELIRQIKTNTVKKLGFDPPYSLRQLKEKYDNLGKSLTQRETTNYWSDLKDEVARVLKPGGKVISFGWNSIGIGKTRGFEITRILMVCHGGHHNDTICTVERKVNEVLF